MRDRLPVHIENRKLPIDNFMDDNKKNSYGYVSVLYLASLIITVASVLTVIILGK